MKIKFNDVVTNKDWLHSEILTSLTGDIISEAMEKGEYDVKLLVNGHELDIKLFNEIFSNLEKYIKKEAESIINDRLSEIEDDARNLEEMVKEATYKIRDKFKIE